MTASDFRARLHSLGLSQVGFAREVSKVGGEELSLRTVENWAQGHRPIPATVPALLRLLESAAEKTA